MKQPMMRPTIIAATIIYTIILLPSIVLAPFAAFLYDDPKSGGLILYTFSFLWYTFPVGLIVGILGAWISHVRKNNKITSGFLLFPIFHALLLAVFGIFQFAS